MSYSRSIDSPKKAAVNVERPLINGREIPQSLMLFGINDEDSVNERGKTDPFALDNKNEMKIRVRMHPHQQQLKGNSRKTNPEGKTDEIRKKEMESDPGLLVDSKIDEYGEDPFEGVTSWPLSEIPEEKGTD